MAKANPFLAEISSTQEMTALSRARMATWGARAVLGSAEKAEQVTTRRPGRSWATRSQVSQLMAPCRKTMSGSAFSRRFFRLGRISPVWRARVSRSQETARNFSERFAALEVAAARRVAAARTRD